MKKMMLAILAVLVFGIGICHGKDRHITSAANPWSPFVDPDMPGQGLSVEIVNAAFASEGYTLDHKFMPWARAEHEVKNGNIDILPDTWFTTRRSRYLMFSTPYASNRIKFIKRKGSSFEYRGIDSLTGKRVGVIIGYGYGDEFMNAKNFTREGVSSFLANIRKLVRNRVDLTLEDEIVARSILRKEAPALLEQIEFVALPLSDNALHIACGLANARHKKIIRAFNRGLATIKANGTFELILKGYGIQ